MKLSADKLLLLKWSQAQAQDFLNAYEISRVHQPHFKKFWFQTDLGRENSTGFYMLDFSHHSHALVTFLVQFLCSDWSKFDRWVHAEIDAASGKLFTDSWSWQSFVSSWDVFNCLFLLDVQNEIQLLSRFLCNSWLVCLLRFRLRNTQLVKVIGNPLSDGIVFTNELTHLPLFEA